MVENRQTFWHKMVLGVVRTIKQEHSLIVDTVLLGIVGALSAQLFIWMLR